MVTVQWKRNDEPLEYKQGVDGVAVIKGDTGPCIYVVTDGNDSTLITQLMTVLESHLATRNGTLLAGLEGTDLSAAWLLNQIETAKHDRQVLAGGSEFAVDPGASITFGYLGDDEGKPLRWQNQGTNVVDLSDTAGDFGKAYRDFKEGRPISDQP